MEFFNFGSYSWWWFPVLVWSLVWKGLALWRAAGQKDKVWFIILFLVNTVGLLEIFYLYLWPKLSKRGISKTSPA